MVYSESGMVYPGLGMVYPGSGGVYTVIRNGKQQKIKVIILAYLKCHASENKAIGFYIKATQFCILYNKSPIDIKRSSQSIKRNIAGCSKLGQNQTSYNFRKYQTGVVPTSSLVEARVN